MNSLKQASLKIVYSRRMLDQYNKYLYEQAYMEVSSRSIFSGSEKYLSDAFCEDVTV
jgi:hypothetical protein